jgi:uncharacterized protein YndB with AHSA1/START domain
MGRIELEAFYPYPIEEVWKALTEADALAQWLMLNEGFEAVVGKKFKFRAKPVMGWKGIAYCEILKVEAPHLISWSQRGEENSKTPFLITWTLQKESQGTRLQLLHEGFHGLQGLMIKRLMGGGWKRMLRDRIPMVLSYAKREGWSAFPKDRRLLPSECHVEGTPKV